MALLWNSSPFRPGQLSQGPPFTAKEPLRHLPTQCIRRPVQLCSAALDRVVSQAQPLPKHPHPPSLIESLDLVRESELLDGALPGTSTLSKIDSLHDLAAAEVNSLTLIGDVHHSASNGTTTTTTNSTASQPKRKHPRVESTLALVAAAAASSSEAEEEESAAAAVAAAGASTVDAGVADMPRVYTPEERKRIRESWQRLMRWSKRLRTREAAAAKERRLEKVVIFGGGSFGTAMGVSLARSHPHLQVALLLRDAYLCRDINEKHRNSRYLPDFELPINVTATTSAVEAISGAQYAIHAVPVQHTRKFLQGIKELISPTLPIISVSKGVELSTEQLMSEVIPSALGRKQPTAYLSGPSFAREVMASRPTGIVAASKDRNLAHDVQKLFASPTMRVSTSHDVVGVEICGALKNVLAIAAGIVEGLDLGHNAMAALVAQGCAEIRWLAEKMGAKPATISGLSGLGDIMLTCYGSLSRNRSVGVRLGKGEALADILASSSQIAEGVATAGVVVSLARKYKVDLPVLTAVAQVLNGNISAAEAVAAIMNLPQVEER